jgi:hypothetical protein
LKGQTKSEASLGDRPNVRPGCPIRRSRQSRSCEPSFWRTCASIALLWVALAPASWAALVGGEIAKDRVAGGEHWRLQTARGPVHLWRPAGYDRRTAGTIVYVHGYAVDADTAWSQHDLARQFEASRRNAVFLIPEAPASSDETVRWPSLTELLSTVGSRLGLAWPSGPLVVVGHSAAHLTVVPWLKNARVGQVILLDAIYGNDTVAALRAWLRTGRGRLVLVAADTAEDAELVLQGLPHVVRRGAIPESGAGFTSGERRARVAYVRSQYGHLEMVTEGKAIAPLLGLTRLPSIAAPKSSAPVRPSR